MTRIVIGILLLIVFGMTSNAQRVKQEDLPKLVKEAFLKQYPGVSAKWEKEDGKFEAVFRKDGEIVSVLYEPDGKLNETETSIRISELPDAAMAYIKVHFKNKTIKETSKIVKADGTVNYEAEVKGKDLIFDGSGKFIRQVKR